MNLLLKYFPSLTIKQIQQLNTLQQLYLQWNTKINLISRKDINSIVEHHFLHSLSIAMQFKLQANSRVIDIGTGGGFPGILLAIYFPEVEFILIDSIAKKIKVVEDIIQHLKLANVQVVCDRIENLNIPCDVIVSRAVAPLRTLLQWAINFIDFKSINVNAGLICLKGGDLRQEILDTQLKNIQQHALSQKICGDFFKAKSILFIPLKEIKNNKILIHNYSNT